MVEGLLKLAHRLLLGQLNEVVKCFFMPRPTGFTVFTCTPTVGLFL